MPIISLKDAQSLKGEGQFQAYGCLDVTGTREIYDALRPQLNQDTLRNYKWAKAQQSPAFTMVNRGVRINTEKRDAVVKALKAELKIAIQAAQANPFVEELWSETELETGNCGSRPPSPSGKPAKHKWPRAPKGAEALDPAQMVCECCGTSRVRRKVFEPTSADACKKLFYRDLKVPIQRSKTGSVTTDDDALLKIAKKKPKLAGLVGQIQTVRDYQKQLGFFNAEISIQGRFHSSFNVGAAWTGRWSSSQDPFRRGGNLQNVAERHRHIFEADKGHKIFYADLKTAESLKVAYMAGDEGYIKAHEGDVHTYVCRLVWPDELPWTGDIVKDKIIASTNYPAWDNVPGHDYRYQSKAVQHGSNYGLTPFGMAIMRHIPVKAAAHAQAQYFRAFPEVREWQKYIQSRVEGGLPLFNALRRVVRLFGRPLDPHTLKQGLAFGAQSGIADVLDCAIWRVWRYCDAVDAGDQYLIQILAQVHDAILGQFPDELEPLAIAALKDLMVIPFPVTDYKGVERVCTIPVEIAVGRNWGKFNADEKKGPLNLDGIKEVK